MMSIDPEIERLIRQDLVENALKRTLKWAKEDANKLAYLEWIERSDVAAEKAKIECELKAADDLVKSCPSVENMIRADLKRFHLNDLFSYRSDIVYGGGGSDD